MATRGLRLKWWNIAAIKQFIRFDTLVNRQIRDSSQCIAYSLRVSLFPVEGWTISAWPDEKALGRFVSGVHHKAAMIEMAHATKEYFAATSWRSLVSRLPQDWNVVVKKFDLSPEQSLTDPRK